MSKTQAYSVFLSIKLIKPTEDLMGWWRHERGARSWAPSVQQNKIKKKLIKRCALKLVCVQQSYSSQRHNVHEFWRNMGEAFLTPTGRAWVCTTSRLPFCPWPPINLLMQSARARVSTLPLSTTQFSCDAIFHRWKTEISWETPWYRATF